MLRSNRAETKGGCEVRMSDEDLAYFAVRYQWARELQWFREGKGYLTPCHKEDCDYMYPIRGTEDQLCTCGYADWRERGGNP